MHRLLNKNRKLGLSSLLQNFLLTLHQRTQRAPQRFQRASSCSQFHRLVRLVSPMRSVHRQPATSQVEEFSASQQVRRRSCVELRRDDDWPDPRRRQWMIFYETFTHGGDFPTFPHQTRHCRISRFIFTLFYLATNFKL